MNKSNDAFGQGTRYHPLYAALHWLMFLLFVVALATITNTISIACKSLYYTNTIYITNSYANTSEY